MHSSRPDAVRAAVATWVAGSAAVVVALAIPLLASPTLVGPDAAMYGAIAVAIRHGAGLVFPDGMTVTARPPLFAIATALLSPVAGVTPAEILLSKIGFAVLLVLATALALRLAGVVAGGLVVVALGISPLMVRWSGATLIDGLAAALALGGIVAFTTDSPGPRRWVLAGLLLGLSFLVKETAILLLFVPLALAITGSETGRRRLDAAWLPIAAFAVVVAPWYAWVAAQTGRTYLLGVSAAIGLAAGLVLLIGMWLVRRRLPLAEPDAERTAPRWAWPAVVALAVAWTLGGWLAIELTAEPSAASNVVRAVYRYARLSLAPDLPLLIGIAAGAIVGVALAVRRPAVRPIAFAAVAMAPVLAFLAQRGFEARSIAIGIAGAIVLAAVVVAEGCAWVERHRRRGGALLGAGAVVVAIGLSVGPTAAAIGRQPALVARATWDRPEVAAVAEWLRSRVPPGGAVVSSWQYAAMLYVEADGAFGVHQVPLRRATATGDATSPLTAVATLDSWQDQPIPASPIGSIVYVARGIPVDLVALDRMELLATLRETRTPFLVAVGAGPDQRSGWNYPFVGAALGSPDVALEQLLGDGDWIRVFDVPAGVTYDSGVVSVDATAAVALLTGDAAADRATFAALGATQIRVWPPRIPDAVLAELRATGLPVVLASDR
jgi:4-amino-4-deoxy-L-arabinose transferase-like glycosyltransferase